MHYMIMHYAVYIILYDVAAIIFVTIPYCASGCVDKKA